MERRNPYGGGVARTRDGGGAHRGWVEEKVGCEREGDEDVDGELRARGEAHRQLPQQQTEKLMGDLGGVMRQRWRTWAWACWWRQGRVRCRRGRRGDEGGDDGGSKRKGRWLN